MLSLLALIWMVIISLAEALEASSDYIDEKLQCLPDFTVLKLRRVAPQKPGTAPVWGQSRF
jgi:hypothetical protein